MLDLVVDPVLPDGLFGEAVEARRQGQALQRLHRLLHARPVPSPHWFPWRSSPVDPPGWRSVNS